MHLNGNAAGDAGTTDTGAAPDSAAGNGQGIVLNGGAGSPPAGDTTTPPAGDSGQGGGDKQTAAQPQGVTLDGKDDTGAGEGSEQGQGGEGDGKGKGGKQGGEAADYAIKYPDGFKAVPEAEAALKAYVKAKNLPEAESAAEAQTLADLYVKTRQEETAELVKQLDATKTAWIEALANDKEFGGPNLKRTSEDANKGLKHYAPELIPLLSQWNLERQPDLVRHFARLGRGLRENRSPKADSPGQHKQKTMVDSKAEMLAREEAKAAGRRA